MEASRKTNAINAYVSGLEAPARGDLGYTIQKPRTNECLFIVGHELGHYVLGMFGKVLAGSRRAMLALYLLFEACTGPWIVGAKDWKLYGQEDWASLAVCCCFCRRCCLFLHRHQRYSRMQEHAADVYGLESHPRVGPRSREVAAHAFQVLARWICRIQNPPRLSLSGFTRIHRWRTPGISRIATIRRQKGNRRST